MSLTCWIWSNISPHIKILFGNSCLMIFVKELQGHQIKSQRCRLWTNLTVNTIESCRLFPGTCPVGECVNNVDTLNRNVRLAKCCLYSLLLNFIASAATWQPCLCLGLEHLFQKWIRKLQCSRFKLVLLRLRDAIVIYCHNNTVSVAFLSRSSILFHVVMWSFPSAIGVFTLHSPP